MTNLQARDSRPMTGIILLDNNGEGIGRDEAAGRVCTVFIHGFDL